MKECYASQSMLAVCVKTPGLKILQGLYENSSINTAGALSSRYCVDTSAKCPELTKLPGFECSLSLTCTSITGYGKSLRV